jgi:hypothetical protein
MAAAAAAIMPKDAALNVALETERAVSEHESKK